jgi:hypothetical protein
MVCNCTSKALASFEEASSGRNDGNPPNGRTIISTTDKLTSLFASLPIGSNGFPPLIAHVHLTISTPLFEVNSYP